MEEKSKKRIIIILVAILIVGVIVAAFIFISERANKIDAETPDAIPVYSEYAPDWIEKTNESLPTVEINVEEATSGYGEFVMEGKQNYIDYDGELCLIGRLYINAL